LFVARAERPLNSGCAFLTTNVEKCASCLSPVYGQKLKDKLMKKTMKKNYVEVDGFDIDEFDMDGFFIINKEIRTATITIEAALINGVE
jgi:hypothetical protein